MPDSLINKYGLPPSGYDTYPGKTDWSGSPPKGGEWLQLVAEKVDNGAGISINIHLPFCEQICDFCDRHKLRAEDIGLAHRYFQAIQKEWNLYAESFSRKPLIRGIHLTGGTPTYFSAKELRQLIEHLLKDSRLAEKAHLSFDAHPLSTGKDHLLSLYELGFRHVTLGIQDFSPEILRAVNRRPFDEEVEKLTSWARKIGYHSINYELIYGLPLQRGADIRYNILRIGEQRPDRVTLRNYSGDPSGKNDFPPSLPLDDRQAKIRHRLYRLAKSLLELQGYTEIGTGLFVLPQNIYYQAFLDKQLSCSIHGPVPYLSSLMIGLGVSGVGDNWTHLVQNSESVQAYIRMVEMGKAPVAKGHVLDQEDLVMRRHIHNLLCKYETSWKNPALQHFSLEEGIMRLREPLIDGLVELSPFHLKITREGRPFVAQISRALDARYWRRRLAPPTA